MQTLGEMIGAVAHDVECKVCQGRATLYGVTDFNKSCEEHRGKYLSLSGVAIYYHRCDSCGLIFTTAFDRWDKADYLRHIYNDAYELVDPDYVDVRPANNAEFILTFIKKGEALGTKASSKTTQCGLCHGADLKGLGPVPGIAGRSPSYLVRQMYDMQQGTRNGTWTQLMKPVVANLSEEDLIDIAAYTASRMP